MIQIQEAQIHTVNKNVNQELIIKIRIKKTDYTHELEELLYSASEDKKVMAIVMEEFGVEKVVNTIGEKRTKLAFLMLKYAEKENSDILDIKQHLYNKYTEKYGFKVNSRTQLLEEDVDEEIKSYKAGLEYNL